MNSGSIPPPSPASFAAVPPAAYAPAPGQPRSSKKLVWIIVAVFLAIVMVVLLFVGAIVFAIFGSLKSSTPYQHAIQVATHDPRVVASLGAPVKPGWLPGGSINVSGDSGNADLTISLEGAAHKGKLHVVAKKAEGEWTYQTLAVRVEDSQERIDLLGQSSASPEEK
ncbi:MAG TPA: cytochrome c oxidase assembly factor Coa1 family protein [Candidatus Angelobacter sp.]